MTDRFTPSPFLLSPYRLLANFVLFIYHGRTVDRLFVTNRLLWRGAAPTSPSLALFAISINVYGYSFARDVTGLC